MFTNESMEKRTKAKERKFWMTLKKAYLESICLVYLCIYLFYFTMKEEKF